MRLYLPPSKAKPAPPPLRTDDRRAVLVGLAVWGVLLVVALAVPEVRDTGEGRWLGSCVAGLALGLVGLAHVHRRERRAARRREDGPAGAGDPRPHERPGP
ncbi:DUF2530 domain-containing protein [Paenibacillus sp. TRM 82003]|uniref:DUF2530 domain-containing protein n=1 Tax=Kineococcus sp. TRM81007 TaxID=2925831 RepID=UPI001F59C558|nr:DUF2530 domain-containing protein [Kineococcus sp. TRM81007]MCI2239960.1 DUF2530 domain-containing protein [Kineococcus sp. TRM81007]MCI3925735.1 DUF2530 domain-containing protein [Paenibacillus sp. TRM 82003]